MNIDIIWYFFTRISKDKNHAGVKYWSILGKTKVKQKAPKTLHVLVCTPKLPKSNLWSPKAQKQELIYEKETSELSRRAGARTTPQSNVKQTFISAKLTNKSRKVFTAYAKQSDLIYQAARIVDGNRLLSTDYHETANDK